MADIYDVQIAVANLAQSAIYPNGLSSPSVAGVDVRIYPGWPIPDTLDKDLTSLKAHVSIFPQDIARASTRFETNWFTTTQNNPTLNLAINFAAQTVTVTGTVSTPQACMIIQNGVAYSYGVTNSDTVNSIAANLGALIPGASVLANVITLSNAYSIAVRIIVAGTSVREVAREKRMFTVTVWAAAPLARSQIASAVTSLFAGTYRFGLPDGFTAQLAYSGSNEIDYLEKVKCYRRDLHMIIEYAITQAQTNYTIGENVIQLSPFNCNTVLPNP